MYVWFATAEPAGSVSICTGETEDRSEEVTFVADWRMAERLLIEKSAAPSGQLLCTVEPYQLLGNYRRAMASVCLTCGGRHQGECQPDDGE